MSLFFRYNKPGKGVSKEDAENRNYFVILFRKFSLIIKANLLFCGINTLLLLALLFPVLPLFLNPGSHAAEQTIAYYANILSGKQFLSPIPFVLLALFAPTFAGLTYLCRNFARQEHVFLAGDFFEQTKKNWRQSLIAGLVLSAALYFYLTAFIFYWNLNSGILRAVISVIGIFLLYLSFYVFPQIVTFKLSLIRVFQNAAIFAVANLPYNTLVFAVLAALHGFLLLTMPVIWLILTVFFLISFSTFTVNFVTWSIISKYMIDPNTKEKRDTD